MNLWSSTFCVHNCDFDNPTSQHGVPLKNIKQQQKAKETKLSTNLSLNQAAKASQ